MAHIADTALHERIVPLRQVFDFIPLRSEPRNMSTLSDQVYEHLLTQIVFPDNKDKSFIHYGGKITESTISQSLRISNGPVREAIFRLRQEGWIHTVSNKGSYFVDFTDPSISRQIYQFRLTFETGAFYTLAAKITDAQLETLNSVLEVLEKAKRDSDMAAFRQSDVLFHLHVIEFAGGPYFMQIFRSKLLQWYAMSYHLLVHTIGKEHYRHLLEASGSPTHRELYESLASRNCPQAADRISRHFTFIPDLLKIMKLSSAKE